MITVLLPAAGAAPFPAGPSWRVAHYGSAADIAALLEAPADGAVLCSDGLPAGALEAAATAVRTWGRPVVEVRSARWDGWSFSPLSAACRGVISGFGPAGLRAAIDFLAPP